MKLIIPTAIEKKIHDYVMSVETEIAGMGAVTIDEDGNAIVEDVMIYEQEVTGGTADLSPRAIAKWQSELVRAGGSPKKWRLWWHSHANMAAFFSKRDTDTIDDSNEAEWMISLVVNKRRDREARLDVYRISGATFRLKLEKIGIEIDGATGYGVPAEIAEEVAAKVKRPAATTLTLGGGSGAGYQLNKEKAGWTGADHTPRTKTDVIDLHRYCPTFTADKKECYLPYGEIKGAAYADCTKKKFRKVYGKHPFTDTAPAPAPSSEVQKYQAPDLDAIGAWIHELESQIRAHEGNGTHHSEECVQLMSELADWYYTLADNSDDAYASEALRAKGANIEDSINFIQHSAV